MLASKLLKDFPNIKTNPHNIIYGITSNSKLVKSGFIFVALSENAECFINDALLSGAIIIISKNCTYDNNKCITNCNPSKIYSKLCAIFHEYIQPNTVVALTGTNGKTSTAEFYRQMLILSGKKSATIGTYGVTSSSYPKENKQPTLTTPDAFELHAILRDMKNNEIEYVAIEASSHGISQHRLHNVNIEVAAFTNISQEHLDYHHNMTEYFNAKKQLFLEILPKNKVAVLNKDAAEYEELARISRETNQKIITFGKNADVTCLKQKMVNDGQHVSIKILGTIYNFFFKVLGSFQVENLMCAICLVIASIKDINQINFDDILKNIITPIGRMEKVTNNVIVDYAHTPDALYKLITSVKKHYPSKKIISIFGCGGNRDKSKRAIMGKVSYENVDITIITNDNFRNENPEIIRKEILTHCKNGIEISNRENAIKTAINMAKKQNAIIIIAGKGHEGYNIANGLTTVFSDKQMALKYDNQTEIQ